VETKAINLPHAVDRAFDKDMRALFAASFSQQRFI
jgi:hypothetical protein